MKAAVGVVVLALLASGVFLAGIGSVSTSAADNRSVEPMRTGTYAWSFYDFFNVPYDTWWTDTSQRPRVYGDVILSNTYPYTNWYPWAGDRYDSTIYTMYRIDMSVTGTNAWSSGTPVILPQFGTGATDPITVDWYMQYVSNTRREQLSSSGCFINKGSMDGFIMETASSFTMTHATAERIFGVTGDPATWWAANTAAGCTSYGALETKWETWLSDLGNGAFDIFNSFEYTYSPWYTEVTYSIVGNEVTVKLQHITWGIEVLMARWMYWGTTTYESMGTPAGWWPWELAWFEDFHLTGTLGTSASDLHLTSAMAYHLSASALGGADGVIGTGGDDTPTWVFQPYLTDYLYSGGSHPVSELDAYIGREMLKTTPGSRYYGDMGVYTFVPKEWDLLAGETVTWDFPDGDVLWYNPQSPENSDPATLIASMGPLTLANRIPSGFGTWDEATNSLTVTGPLDGTLPANPDYGTPWVEVGPETPSGTPDYLADLVRRSAWPERHHYVISADADRTLLLYGKAQNLGGRDTAVSVRFTVSKGGSTTTWDSAAQVLVPGQRWDFTVGLPGLTPGKYSVVAQAWYDTNGDGVPDTAGAKMKSFSFSAVP